MANFEFRVNNATFRQFGVRPVIDESLYGELIDDHAPDSSSLDVIVTPSVYWSGHSLLKIINDIHKGSTVLPVGSHSETKQSILLPAHPNAERTNKLLLHETKHHIDHMNGEVRR